MSDLETVIQELEKKDVKSIPQDWEPDNYGDYDVGFIHGVRYALGIIKENIKE